MLKDPSYHLLLEIKCSAWFWKSQLVCNSEIKTNIFKNSSSPHLLQNSSSRNFNKSIPIPQLAYKGLNSPHNLAFPQLSLEKKYSSFSEGCENLKQSTGTVQRKWSLGILCYKMTNSAGTQLHRYSAGDKEVSRAISLHFKSGQKAPNPRNCYTGVVISAAAGCLGATGFCFFTPYTAIWMTKSITWKTVASAAEAEMGAINNGDSAVAPDALSVSDWGFCSDNCRHPPQHQYVCIPSATLQQRLWLEEWEAEAKVCLCTSLSLPFVNLY